MKEKVKARAKGVERKQREKETTRRGEETT